MLFIYILEKTIWQWGKIIKYILIYYLNQCILFENQMNLQAKL